MSDVQHSHEDAALSENSGDQTTHTKLKELLREPGEPFRPRLPQKLPKGTILGEPREP